MVRPACEITEPDEAFVVWKTLHVAILVAGLTAAPAIARNPDVQKGRAIAERLCARCHDITPAGKSPLALAPPFRVLPNKYPVEQLAEALAEGIVTGHPDMPQFTFNPPEIDALLSFIDSLAVETKPGNAGKK
jgi:cytochrome c